MNFEIAEDLFLISPLQFWYATLLVGYLAQEDVEPEPEGEPEPELGWSILFLTMLIKRIECYVCTGTESLDSCAVNQTADSAVETCAPGFHCSVRLEISTFAHSVFRHTLLKSATVKFIIEAAQNRVIR